MTENDEARMTKHETRSFDRTQSSVGAEHSVAVHQSSVAIPSVMRAAVITAPRNVDIVQTETPQPEANQILVRIEGCGVCASNIPPWQGKPWFTYPMAPGALGHEAWGRVAEVGNTVCDFAKGDRVAILSNHGYAEYDVCDSSSAVKLPRAFAGRPFPGEPLGCAMNIFHRSNIGRGDTVAVVGIGFLGALLTQLACATGARVIALARRSFALGLAKQMGATQTIPLGDDAIDNIKDLTNGRLCDVVVECTGKQWPLDVAGEITRERGRLIIAGYHQDGARQVNMQLWNWRGLDVINAHERDPQVYVDGIRQAVRAVKAGLLDPAPLYTDFFPLEQLGDALDTAVQRPDGFMKAVITT
jgi:threonine dehydrogenase-like Zn-dependent dehydrogenase